MYYTGVHIADAKAPFLGERACPGMSNDTAVSSAKMAEAIEIPFGCVLFGLCTRLSPRNHELDVGQDGPKRMGNFTEKDMPGHVRRHSAVSCATSSSLSQRDSATP